MGTFSPTSSPGDIFSLSSPPPPSPLLLFLLCILQLSLRWSLTRWQCCPRHAQVSPNPIQVDFQCHHFGFLSRTFVVLGQFFLFIFHGRGRPGLGATQRHTACDPENRHIHTRQSPTGSERGSVTGHGARTFVLCGVIAD